MFDYLLEVEKQGCANTSRDLIGNEKKIVQNTAGM